MTFFSLYMQSCDLNLRPADGHHASIENLGFVSASDISPQREGILKTLPRENLELRRSNDILR